MKRHRFYLIILTLCSLISAATKAEGLGKCTIYDTQHIRSLQLVAQGNALLPPVMELGHCDVTIGFDEMSHEYHRYIYHIDHCEADWTVSEGIFESNYLDGLNDQPIEDYEKSFNTVQIYTHYSISLPNDQTRPLLSGNYRVTVYDEDVEVDDDEDVDSPAGSGQAKDVDSTTGSGQTANVNRNTPKSYNGHKVVLTAEFSLVEPLMSVSGMVDGNTDIDFQRSHQQLSLSLGYGSLRVTDPERELKIFVIQNRRPDICVEVKANIRKANGLELSHHRGLIFPATSECHKFEILDVQRANLNVDNIRWFEPYYHATLYEERQQHNYTFDEDANGAYVMRNADNEDNETTSEYIITHFRLKTDRLEGGDVYIQGNWCNQWPNDEYKMEYNATDGEYQCAVLLKQGYYNYRFVQLTGEKTAAGIPIGTTNRTDGNFYQTENEYIVLVYYKEPGGRYDRLVGVWEN